MEHYFMRHSYSLRGRLVFLWGNSLHSEDIGVDSGVCNCLHPGYWASHLFSQKIEKEEARDIGRGGWLLGMNTLGKKGNCGEEDMERSMGSRALQAWTGLTWQPLPTVLTHILSFKTWKVWRKGWGPCTPWLEIRGSISQDYIWQHCRMLRRTRLISHPTSNSKLLCNCAEQLFPISLLLEIASIIFQAFWILLHTDYISKETGFKCLLNDL